MSKRFLDETNQVKKSDYQTLLNLIREQWMVRLEKGGDSSGAPAEGVMSTMGYRVGDTQGIRKEYRINIMIDVLTEPLPFVESPSYMQEWGEERSITRYNKLKNFLSGEINSPLQRNNFRAVSEWKEDLEWVLKYGMEYIR